MKEFRTITLALSLAGLLAAPAPAAAQAPYRQLGWVSSMTASCMDPACLTVGFTLSLNGLQPTDHTGALVPAGLGSAGGYLNWLTLTSLGGVNFTNASILTGGTWFSIPILSTLLNFAIPAYPVAPVALVATFNSGAYLKQFSYFGSATLNSAGTPQTAPCNAGTCTYIAGDLSGGTTATPEPVTMALLATSLAGLALVARRKQQRNTESV